jgi:ATP-dependent Clp protease ATP-binding subunit ClpA
VLSRRKKNNPVLIGEPGVGKTAIAEGLAQRIVEGNVPQTLENKRVVTLDMASLGGRHQVPRPVRRAPQSGHE